MTTYNTYQEAKIAHPKSLILVRDGSFDAMENIASSQFDKWDEVNPADHCMTVKDFLSSGYEFVKGDIYMFSDGFVNTVKTPENKPAMGDSSRYILRAAALQTPEQESTAKLELASDEFRRGIAKVLNESIAEIQDGQNKSRTKVEYEKVISVFQLNADEMHNGVYGWLNDDGEFFPSTNEALTVGALTKDNLYRKVERPIEWWEDAAEFIKSNSFNIGKQACKVGDGAFYVDSKMTRDQWCDFARILLEQEGE